MSCKSLCRLGWKVCLCLMLAECFVLGAEPLNVRVCIKAVNGHAIYSTNGATFGPLTPGNYQASAGLALTTDTASTVDFILLDSGTALRLMPDSSITFTRLSKLPVGEQVVSDTTMKIVKGSVIGVQRKLAVPSHFEVVMPGSTATIVGTEYIINASGAVTVLSGEVSINYNLPHNRGSVNVTIPQGYTFDPATDTVVPTKPSYLQNIVDDINTVRENAQTFRVNGATIVVRPEEESPDRDHDHDDEGHGHGGDGGGRH